MATNNKPANTLRCGNIKATIWQNAQRERSVKRVRQHLHRMRGLEGCWRGRYRFTVSGPTPVVEGVPTGLNH